MVNFFQVPIYAKHNIVYREGSSGRFDVSIGHKNTAGKTVSGDHISNCNTVYSMT